MDVHTQMIQMNFLSHLLMISKLLDGMQEAPNPCLSMIGSVTRNNEQQRRRGQGGSTPSPISNSWTGSRRVSTTLLPWSTGAASSAPSNFLHSKFHKSQGVIFSSIYSICISETPLFQKKCSWFLKYVPIVMKYTIGKYMSMDEGGQCLFWVGQNSWCNKNGVYWSWDDRPHADRRANALEKSG
jgi:protochlorophyllide reductase